MTAARAHRRLERLLAAAITARDPVIALQQAARDPLLTDELRRALAAVDDDGLRMAALLVTRLRFERLVRASPDAEAWFERDPADFTAAFRRYHHATPPTAFFAAAEARLFSAWRARDAAARAPFAGAGARKKKKARSLD